jgi:hypothetical protein
MVVHDRPLHVTVELVDNSSLPGQMVEIVELIIRLECSWIHFELLHLMVELLPEVCVLLGVDFLCLAASHRVCLETDGTAETIYP